MKDEDFKPNALDTPLAEPNAPELLIKAHDLLGLAAFLGGALLIVHVVGSLTADIFPLALEPVRNV